MSQVHVEDLVDHIKPRTASNMLLWGIFAFFVIAVLWAALAKIDRSVIGVGRVIPSSQLQVVSNLEGGVVEEILAHTGDTVKEGAPLLKLNPVQMGAELGSSTAATNALRLKIARLQGEIMGRDPVYPAVTDPTMAEQIAIEQALHRARLADLQSATATAGARASQALRSVEEASSMYQARSATARSYSAQAAALRPLVEKGIEPSMSLVQMEGNAAAARGEAAAASEAIGRARASVSEARSAEMQVRETWRARAGDELAAAQAELGAKRAAIPALSDRMKRTIVRAPLSGRVNRVLVSTVGGTVRPGEPLAEIVPSERGLLVEVQVSPKDIAFIRLGQRAKVDITAYDPAIYGSMHGKVTSISPDSVLNERTGELHYIVKVRTDTDVLVATNGQRLPVGTGMVASANLIGDKRTVLEYIFTPIARLRERAFTE